MFREMNATIRQVNISSRMWASRKTNLARCHATRSGRPGTPAVRHELCPSRQGSLQRVRTIQLSHGPTWHYVLMAGTNRNKSVDEIAHARSMDLDQLKARMADMAVGEVYFLVPSDHPRHGTAPGISGQDSHLGPAGGGPSGSSQPGATLSRSGVSRIWSRRGTSSERMITSVAPASMSRSRRATSSG